MPDTHVMPDWRKGAFERPVWVAQSHPAIVNLRGDPGDARILAAAQAALGVALPGPCTTVQGPGVRLVWAGPDDWFVIGEAGTAAALEKRLRDALAGVHCAVTDVSSGYFQITVAGERARELLAQGCPLDLHPDAFPMHHAAGTHFFKVSLYLWLADERPGYQMLVRRSFIDHFWQLVSAGSREFGVGSLVAS